MSGRLNMRSWLALAMALTMAIGAVSAVSAEKGKGGPGGRPGPGGKQMVLHGIIAAIDGDVITLRQADGTDVQMAMSEQTRIAPRGVTPQVGMKAQAVLRKPATEGDPLLLVVLVLVDQPKSPGEPRLGPPVHGCGTITALPETTDPSASPWLGLWTIRVPEVAEYSLLVTEETRIGPPDAEPQVGARACFTARQSEDGLVAQTIGLVPQGKGPGHKGTPRWIVLRGSIVTLPDDQTFPWDLVVAVPGASDQTVTVTQETQIRGQLAVGVAVVIHAQQVTDAAGTVTLVAKTICVCTDRCQEDLPL